MQANLVIAAEHAIGNVAVAVLDPFQFSHDIDQLPNSGLQPPLRTQMELGFMEEIKQEEAERTVARLSAELQLARELLDLANAPEDWAGDCSVPGRMRALAERWLSFSGMRSGPHADGCACKLCRGSRAVRNHHEGAGGGVQWILTSGMVSS